MRPRGVPGSGGVPGFGHQTYSKRERTVEAVSEACEVDQCRLSFEGLKLMQCGEPLRNRLCLPFHVGQRGFPGPR